MVFWFFYSFIIIEILNDVVYFWVLVLFLDFIVFWLVNIFVVIDLKDIFFLFFSLNELSFFVFLNFMEGFNY